MSMDKRVPMKEIAKAILIAHEASIKDPEGEG
jgi:AmiR/NasT family two-component response regulator